MGGVVVGDSRFHNSLGAMPAVTTKYTDAQEILKTFQVAVGTLKVDDDFATAGVDSFEVMSLCEKIRSEIDMDINPTSVFQWGTCTKFAEGIRELIASAPDIKKEDVAATAAANPVEVTTTKKYNIPAGSTEVPAFAIDAPEDTVENLMAHLGLSVYAPAMIDEGYDDVKIIQVLEEDDFNELCNDTAKMKKGHYRKFKMWKDATNPKLAKAD